MLIELDNRVIPITPIGRDRREVELRWLVTVDADPAAHHTLRIAAGERGERRFLHEPLPRWSATAAAWASTLRWTLQVRPRVLRSADPFVGRLCTAETAAALVIFEQGSDAAGVRIEHELTVLARFADHALTPGWQQRASRVPDRGIPSAVPAWRVCHTAA